MKKQGISVVRKEQQRQEKLIETFCALFKISKFFYKEQNEEVCFKILSNDAPYEGMTEEFKSLTVSQKEQKKWEILSTNIKNAGFRPLPRGPRGNYCGVFIPRKSMEYQLLVQAFARHLKQRE